MFSIVHNNMKMFYIIYNGMEEVQYRKQWENERLCIAQTGLKEALDNIKWHGKVIQKQLKCQRRPCKKRKKKKRRVLGKRLLL